jgi:hypothetical protein
MTRIRICDDPAEAHRLWRQCWPQLELWDHWQLRACFAAHYERPLHFLVAERTGRVVGLAALCWLAEEQRYAQFPGEAWHGKTWIELNRLPAADDDVLTELHESLPPGTHLRYLIRAALPPSVDPEDAVDEVGYLFEPLQHGDSYERYL